MLKPLLLILVAELWGVAGQILFKKSVNSLEPPRLRCAASYLNFVWCILRTRKIWLGLCFVAMGTVVWLTALAQTELSLAFPIKSVQYVLILIAARLFLHERIDAMKLAGTLFVIAGIILITVS
jgi:drug/metabolite transporter (DMT)-like permease